ncbi:hypothetical protein FRC19_001544 [Serendipita sp. 401]|nr:hypothetical protein FRC19_001544 [Serendipita sp. 401]KAG9055630.1 hypothetical protein FS842_001695 [Serendipita sp. 407]
MFPSVQERALFAQDSHVEALELLPDLRTIATAAQLNDDIRRLYTDVGWSKRGVLKERAETLVPLHYKLELPIDLASAIAGGNSLANCKQFIQTRMKALESNGEWLRGEFDGGHMLYANMSIAMLIEQVIFRRSSTIQKQALTPMPPTVVAAAATAIQCALEEWASGSYHLINFTQQTYRRHYEEHCRRLQSLVGTYPEEMDALFERISEYCRRRLANPAVEEDEAPEVPFRIFSLFSDPVRIS